MKNEHYYQQAVDDIYQGNRVKCTKEEYESGLRTYIQDQAGKWIDCGEHLRAMIALEEVKRLDHSFKD